jgi:protein-tyrosine phosphatase
MCLTAQHYGIKLEHSARQFTENDFREFDMILVMDKSNYRDLVSLANGNPEYLRKIEMLLLYDGNSGKSFQQIAEVPDPYFGGDAGFHEVYDMLDRACRKLLTHVKEKLNADKRVH